MELPFQYLQKLYRQLVRQDEEVDTEGGEGLNGNIGWVRSGEWLEYTIDVTEANYYDLLLNYSSAYGGAEFYLIFDGENITAKQIPLITESWADYKDHLVSSVYLYSGKHVMRILFEKGGLNLKSISFNVNTTVISDIEQTHFKQVNIVPNPVSSYVNVDFNDVKYNSLRILNVSGSVVYQESLSDMYQNKIRLDMSDFKSGVYLLELSGYEYNSIVKIVKQ